MFYTKIPTYVHDTTKYKNGDIITNKELGEHTYALAVDYTGSLS